MNKFKLKNSKKKKILYLFIFLIIIFIFIIIYIYIKKKNIFPGIYHRGLHRVNSFMIHSFLTARALLHNDNSYSFLTSDEGFLLKGEDVFTFFDILEGDKEKKLYIGNDIIKNPKELSYINRKCTVYKEKNKPHIKGDPIKIYLSGKSGLFDISCLNNLDIEEKYRHAIVKSKIRSPFFIITENTNLTNKHKCPIIIPILNEDKIAPIFTKLSNSKWRKLAEEFQKRK